jgi:hypothetical protein
MQNILSTNYVVANSKYLNSYNYKKGEFVATCDARFTPDALNYKVRPTQM